MNTTTRKARSVIAAITLFGSLVTGANAAITISNFSLTANSVSFNISGTLPSPAPADSNTALFFTNPTIAASPGFALDHLAVASSANFSGTHSLHATNPAGTGLTWHGDYFYVSFDTTLLVGEAISGNFSATWGTPVFDPSQVTDLNVYWGANGALPQAIVVTGGTLLTTTAVPEPSSTALLGLGCLALALRRSRD